MSENVDIIILPYQFQLHLLPVDLPDAGADHDRLLLQDVLQALEGQHRRELLGRLDAGQGGQEEGGQDVHRDCHPVRYLLAPLQHLFPHHLPRARHHPPALHQECLPVPLLASHGQQLYQPLHPLLHEQKV